MSIIDRFTPWHQTSRRRDVPTAQEIWAQPEPSNDQTWAICPYLWGRNLKECSRCPEWEEDERHGKVKRGCRMMAEEACRVMSASASGR